MLRFIFLLLHVKEFAWGDLLSALPELNRDDSFVLMLEAGEASVLGLIPLFAFSLGYSALPELWGCWRPPVICGTYVLTVFTLAAESGQSSSSQSSVHFPSSQITVRIRIGQI